MAGAEDMLIEDEDEAVGLGAEAAPNEKKSIAGVGAGAGARAASLGLSSSNEMLDLPFASDGGRKGIEGAGASSSSVGGAEGNALKDKAWPLPPPRTRSVGAGTGFFCFGAGSIDISDDIPAPDSNRGFFATGLDISCSSPSSFTGLSEGRAIATRFFVLGGGRAMLDDEVVLD